MKHGNTQNKYDEFLRRTRLVVRRRSPHELRTDSRKSLRHVNVNELVHLIYLYFKFASLTAIWWNLKLYTWFHMGANTSARHTVLSDDFLISIFRTPIIVTKKIRSCIILPLVTVQLFSILFLLWSILNAPILSKNAHISTTHDPHNDSDENLTSLRESRSRLEEDQFAPLVGLIHKKKLKFGEENSKNHFLRWTIRRKLRSTSQ